MLAGASAPQKTNDPKPSACHAFVKGAIDTSATPGGEPNSSLAPAIKHSSFYFIIPYPNLTPRYIPYFTIVVSIFFSIIPAAKLDRCCVLVKSQPYRTQEPCCTARASQIAVDSMLWDSCEGISRHKSSWS